MTLRLNQGTIPSDLPVKTWGSIGSSLVVDIGQYQLSMDDFVSMAEYVLTNTDLVPNDPRLDLVSRVAASTKARGWNENEPGSERIVLGFPRAPKKKP